MTRAGLVNILRFMFFHDQIIEKIRNAAAINVIQVMRAGLEALTRTQDCLKKRRKTGQDLEIRGLK